jgi:hypothetical protein
VENEGPMLEQELALSSFSTSFFGTFGLAREPESNIDVVTLLRLSREDQQRELRAG